MDPRIRIHTKTSWIRNTGILGCLLCYKISLAQGYQPLCLTREARHHLTQRLQASQAHQRRARLINGASTIERVCSIQLQNHHGYFSNSSTDIQYYLQDTNMQRSVLEPSCLLAAIVTEPMYSIFDHKSKKLFDIL